MPKFVLVPNKLRADVVTTRVDTQINMYSSFGNIGPRQHAIRCETRNERHGAEFDETVVKLTGTVHTDPRVCENVNQAPGITRYAVLKPRRKREIAGASRYESDSRNRKSEDVGWRRIKGIYGARHLPKPSGKCERVGC